MGNPLKWPSFRKTRLLEQVQTHFEYATPITMLKIGLKPCESQSGS